MEVGRLLEPMLSAATCKAVIKTHQWHSIQSWLFYRDPDIIDIGFYINPYII